MQIAKCRVVLNHFGSSVEKHDITPAEAQVLQEMHNMNVGSDCIIDLKASGKAQVRELDPKDDEKTILRDRTPLEEVSRLKRIYNAKFVEKLFPGRNPTVPETFKEAGIQEGLAFQSTGKAPERPANRSFPSENREDYVVNA